MLLISQLNGGISDAPPYRQPRTAYSQRSLSSRAETAFRAAGNLGHPDSRLDIERRVPELAMFNLAIDSKLRDRDLVRLKVSDVMHGRRAAGWAGG